MLKTMFREGKRRETIFFWCKQSTERQSEKIKRERDWNSPQLRAPRNKQMTQFAKGMEHTISGNNSNLTKYMHASQTLSLSLLFKISLPPFPSLIHLSTFISSSGIETASKQSHTYSSSSSSQRGRRLSRCTLFIYFTLECRNKRHHICMRVYTLIQNNLLPLFGTQCISLLSAIFITLTCWMGEWKVLERTNKRNKSCFLPFLWMWRLKCFWWCCHFYDAIHIVSSDSFNLTHYPWMTCWHLNRISCWESGKCWPFTRQYNYRFVKTKYEVIG